MKKNLLTVLILALMVVNIVLTTIIMVSVISANKKTADLVGNIATALNIQFAVPGSEGEAEPAVPLEDIVVYALPDSQMVQVPTADGGTVYFVFNLSLSMDSKGDGYKKHGESITSGSYDSMILDQVNSIVAAHTEEECRNDIESIKKEILQAIQDFTGYKFVYKINISGVKFT
ncbi:MAG: flagellar basal body-associated FliL family protein [Eubacterium sp.]|nr:flagellar basal body-associated FliL family protein [Eubacterium sp.]MCM1216237.1 flagellar basal body-associated FliL family protein [Lachnospiraceae bacterium]MCM1304900.1 flagellar basal body-associated FliL family protein [Butyrivibrio sp.]MCM1343334.1 flagellar basal body-associated FliL family protein [Muribaculaceae bacterium]MCM1238855.1 flagellar basal body-associated FliL family protein [Lachnospiraceae bacterium]